MDALGLRIPQTPSVHTGVVASTQSGAKDQPQAQSSMPDTPCFKAAHWLSGWDMPLDGGEADPVLHRDPSRMFARVPGHRPPRVLLISDL